ncbi:MAG: rRNA maturation RNase YbeY [Chloroflexota bacterium]
MPDYQIELQLNLGDKDDLSPVITDVAKAVLIHQSVASPATLTVMVSDDANLHELNRMYRNEDKPTDVLSFEDGTTWPDGTLYLGDIAISLETAERQAKKGGHALQDEVALLTAHGVLHLLGHDHAEAVEKNKMWAAQAKALQSAGFNNISYPE